MFLLNCFRLKYQLISLKLKINEPVSQISQFEDIKFKKSLALHKNCTFFLNYITNYHGLSFTCTNFYFLFQAPFIDLVAHLAKEV
jgi:hypothetical protein